MRMKIYSRSWRSQFFGGFTILGLCIVLLSSIATNPWAQGKSEIIISTVERSRVSWNSLTFTYEIPKTDSIFKIEAVLSDDKNEFKLLRVSVGNEEVEIPRELYRNLQSPKLKDIEIYYYDIDKEKEWGIELIIPVSEKSESYLFNNSSGIESKINIKPGGGCHCISEIHH